MAADASPAPTSTQTQLIDRLARLPYWLVLMVLAGVFLLYQFLTDETYSAILGRLKDGVLITVLVTLFSYAIAVTIGLVVGLGRVSKNPVLFNLATLYVQIVRGVPMLVLIFYVAFVVAPVVFDFIPALKSIDELHLRIPGVLDFTIQNFNLLVRAIIALSLAYGGFEAETFRAGIESIGRGQMEAARSLGMSYFQSMRYIILPQAIRRILPPLGNDFISMLKDSSLVSVLGVRDITQEARLYSAKSFRFPETYNTLGFIYLSMTLVLSLAVRWVENRLGKGMH